MATAQRPARDPFPLAQHLLDLADWVLAKTGRFPVHQRLLGEFLARAALEGLEASLSAYRLRQAEAKIQAIEAAAGHLERVRWLGRLAARQRLLNADSQAHLAGLVDTCQRQFAAWWSAAQRQQSL